MGEHHKECQECGWRGSAAELDETNDASTGKTQIFCPACGGKDFGDLNPDEKGQAPVS
jgi:DNA-directed RNA polymerase subunit RPC12/RpoP